MMIEDRILIHIGYHKTGSTFLQKSVFTVFGIKQLMIPMDQIAKSEGYNPETVSCLLADQYQVNTWDKNRILISQESLVGHKDGDPVWDRFAIARNLKATFPNAKILIVIRDQFDYILSLYTFMVFVKGIERRHLEDYLIDNMHLEPGLRGALQYDILVEYYETLFGTGNVLVLPYELLAQSEVIFVERISNFMGWNFELNFEPGRVNLASRNRAIILTSRLLNYPFSLLLEWLVRSGTIPRERPIPNKMERGIVLLREKLINPGLQWLFSRNADTLDIPSKWNDVLFRIFSASNHRLAKMTGLDLKGYGYPW